MRDPFTFEERVALWVLAVLLAIVCIPTASGATYYVRTDGHDTASGGNNTADESSGAWLTVQKAANTMSAGDVVIVTPGNYVETVTTKATGTDSDRIVFRAEYPGASDPAQMSIIRAFRVQHGYNTLDGLHVVRGGADLNIALVRIEKNGGNTILTNAVIRDSLLVVSTNADFGSNWMHATDVVFTNFSAGDMVFIGADSRNWHTNHDTALTVASNTVDRVYFQEALLEDTGTNYWAPLYAGGDNAGYRGVYFDNTGGSPTNVIIRDCTISNCFGSALQLTGDGHVIEDNIIAGMKGRYAFRLNSSNTQVRRNLIYEGKNIIWFTQWELQNVVHPPGGDWYDYQANIMDCQPVAGVVVTNNLMEYNWFQDLDNQAGLWTGNDVSSGLILRSNVFVGIQAQGGGSMDNVTYDHNTFYRAAFGEERSMVLAMGGLSDGNHQIGLSISNNVFVDVGDHHLPELEGAYTVITEWSDDYILTNNYAAGPESMGWPERTVTAGGITWSGGDPIFQDASNPLGPDGLPFTDDDGLKPLLNSVIALNGLGALTPVTMAANQPKAHFTLLSPTGWFEALGTNYNPAWVATRPGLRGGNLRPWTTPESLGHVPLLATFDARNTMSGLAGVTNSYGVRYFHWSFGDGATALTVLPIVSHTYMTTGAMAVVLTVTNIYGNYASITNTYRTLEQTNSATMYWVATNGNDSADGSLETPWLTLNHAADVVAAGDYVGVLAGSYPEYVDLTTAGTVSSPIRFVSFGASVGNWNMRKSHCWIEGFETTCKTASATNHAFYLYANTTNIVLVNNQIGPNAGNTSCMGVNMIQGDDGTPDSSPQSVSLSNNVFSAIDYIQINLMGRGHRVQGNLFRDANAQADLFRLFGADHVCCDNFAINFCKTYNNHADIIQTFGQGTGGTEDYIVVTNIVIERNTILDSDMAVCQMENYTNAAGGITNIIFRNNIVNITGGGSVDVCGTKWYNNIFYRIPAGTCFVFGGPKGDAYGTEILNNIFYECGYGYGTNSGQGWYSRMESQSISNYSLAADYNFVAGTNNAAKSAAPPSAADRWGSSGGVPLQTWETHGINGGNPLFVDAANFDFRIATNSPLASKGTVISGFTDTIDRQTRPGVWSIGPHEPGGGAAPEPPPSPPTGLRSATAVNATVGALTVQ